MFVKSNGRIPDKNTLRYCLFVACACELTLLFSVVFCLGRFVRRFDFRPDRTWTPRQWRHAVTGTCWFWQDVRVLLVRLAQELILWRRQGQSCCYQLLVLPHTAVCGTWDCLDGEQDNIAVIWDVVSWGLVHRYMAGACTAMCSRVGCVKFVELFLPWRWKQDLDVNLIVWNKSWCCNGGCCGDWCLDVVC
jgi:hypothetical protein